MASKKKATKTGERKTGPNKSEFIRQHSEDSAADVVAKGKAAGLSFTPEFVYAVRSKAKATKTPRSKAKPGPKPGRKAAAASGEMSASDFVRSMPLTAKAKDIVVAGKAKGIKISPNLVYMVRSSDKKKGGKAGTKGTRGRKAAPVVSSTGDLSTFKRLALDLGIATARQALDELDRGLAALLG